MVAGTGEDGNAIGVPGCGPSVDGERGELYTGGGPPRLGAGGRESENPCGVRALPAGLGRPLTPGGMESAAVSAARRGAGEPVDWDGPAAL